MYFNHTSETGVDAVVVAVVDVVVSPRPKETTKD